MRVRWPALAFIVAAGLGYMASPYVALYRLGMAIHGADATTLQAMVDWYSVREGIKEDVCDAGSDVQSGALPPFGASFARGIASTSIDRAVTPQAVLAAVTTAPAQPASANVHIGWAFFDGIKSFSVNLHAPGEKDPIRLRLTFRDWAWHVHRVWLPDDMLSASGTPS